MMRLRTACSRQEAIDSVPNQSPLLTLLELGARRCGHANARRVSIGISESAPADHSPILRPTPRRRGPTIAARERRLGCWETR